MLQFRTSEKAQTHTKSMQQKSKLLQKETEHAKQSVDKKAIIFPQ